MKSVLTLVAPPDRQPLSDAVTTVLLQRLHQVGATTGDIAWLLEGIACDIPFDNLPVDQAQQLVAATLTELPIDFHVQPTANRRKKLLLSDMDSTILTNETLDDIADIAGLKDEIAAITARAMAGELDFTQALIERIAMLAELSETALAKAFDRIGYSAGGATMVATMRKHGAYTALVSGGFKYFTKRVAATVGFDLDLANDLEISDGRLTGRLQGPILDPDAKLSALIRLSDEHGLTPADAVTVGDGSNDIPMLRAAGLGVAYRGKPIVRQAIGCQVNHTDLTTLLYFQGYRQTDFVTGNYA
ncbi:MAG: phosphoserine phosphatase SerB [Rhodospirillaceae bacterium]|nr:MAG: phosphoserine phosphatase SerB [Rhodospirillaceae bacterium]